LNQAEDFPRWVLPPFQTRNYPESTQRGKEKGKTMNPTIQLKPSVVCPRKRLTKTKILREIFIGVGVLFAFTQLLVGGTSDGVLNFSDRPLVHRDPTFITFDAPGSVNGTYPSGINTAGVITGTLLDVNFVGHGFLRTKNGTITTFDVPDAINGTYPSGINAEETVIGTFFDANFVGHGFLRTKNGDITTFDVPDAFNGFFLSGINPPGTIIGTLLDVKFLLHGFIRAKDGTITMLDFPSAANGTQAIGINPRGMITGTYTDVNSVTHGFLRAKDGTLTTFDPPTPGFMQPFCWILVRAALIGYAAGSDRGNLL
jgi:hypothetical protein